MALLRGTLDVLVLRPARSDARGGIGSPLHAFRFGPGETYDFELELVPAPGELRIEVRSPNDFDVVVPVRGS